MQLAYTPAAIWGGAVCPRDVSVVQQLEQQAQLAPTCCQGMPGWCIACRDNVLDRDRWRPSPLVWRLGVQYCFQERPGRFKRLCHRPFRATDSHWPPCSQHPTYCQLLSSNVRWHAVVLLYRLPCFLPYRHAPAPKSWHVLQLLLKNYRSAQICCTASMRENNKVMRR